MKHLLIAGLGVLSVGLAGGPVYGVMLGQIDTFETETTEGWDGGSRVGIVMSVNTSTGGPAGVGDAFLEVEAGGFHLATKNNSQWAGDYLAAGVTDIKMDVDVFSYALSSGWVAPTNAQLRLILWGPGGMWTTSTFVPITTADGWEPIAFGVSPGDLTHVQDGTGVASDTLSNVTNLMIRNDGINATPQGAHPPHVNAVLGIDNIQAVPEPTGLTLLGLGATGWIGRRRVGV